MTKDESYSVGALRARLADTSMKWSRAHVEGLINQIAELTKQRDEGWDNFYKLRKQVAEERYPGMTGIVRAHEPTAEGGPYGGARHTFNSPPCTDPECPICGYDKHRGPFWNGHCMERYKSGGVTPDCDCPHGTCKKASENRGAES